jgi:hypothetical protein
MTNPVPPPAIARPIASINAPASAYTPEPPPNSKDRAQWGQHMLNHRFGETFEDFMLKVPEQTRDAFYAWSNQFNHVEFPGRPAGTDVPREAGGWSFAALGDFGSGTKDEAYVLHDIESQHPAFMVGLGDNVYFQGLEREYATNYDPQKLMGGVVQQMPVMPALGNHDVDVSDSTYFRRFPFLNNARYYSYDYKNAHFLVLDSNEDMAPGSPEYKFAQADLEAHKNARWKVVYMHHPVFSTTGRSPLNERKYLAPLLSKEGVDLILCGHDHKYERSEPLNGRGMVQVVEGGGGGIQYPYMKQQAAFSAYRSVDFGNLNVEVDPDRMVLREMLPDGSVGDAYVMHHGADPTAANTRLLYPMNDQQHNPALIGLGVGGLLATAGVMALRLHKGVHGHGKLWWLATAAMGVGALVAGGLGGWLGGGLVATPESPVPRPAAVQASPGGAGTAKPGSPPAK